MVDENDQQMPKLNEIFACNNQTFKILAIIYRGPFSHVYKLENIEKASDFYAMKCEKRSALMYVC